MATRIRLHIDARGMRCPRPIVELAKARRKALPGSVIVIVADDLAFESDLRAWCNTTDNKLLTLERNGETVTAAVELLGGRPE
jgi:TusA-related sulfurtransferase